MTAKQNIKPDTVYQVRGTELIPPYLVRTDSELEWSDSKVWVTEGFFLYGQSHHLADLVGRSPWRGYGNSRQRISPVRLTEVAINASATGVVAVRS